MTEEEKKEEQQAAPAQAAAPSTPAAENSPAAGEEGLSRLEAPAHSASGTAFLSLLHLTMLNLAALSEQ